MRPGQFVGWVYVATVLVVWLGACYMLYAVAQ